MSKLIVSSSPHIHSKDSVNSIMMDVIIALLPAGIASVWLFGLNSLFLILTCVITAVASEFISRKIMHRKNTIGDLSAVVTGLLLAYNLPSSLPLWMAALGSFIAIVIVKQLFGGIGQNFVNPALIGRIVLTTSFSTAMTKWVAPFAYKNADIVTGATPLTIMRSSVNAVSNATADAVSNATHAAQATDEMPSVVQLLIGQNAGSLGETCAIALIIGGLYLVIRRVISPIIPLCFIGTTALIMLIAGYDPLLQVLSGGLLLGAIFMATDYTTSPVTFKGKFIFAIGCGVITSFIRIFGSITEGVSFAIIIMNVVTPYIERLTAPKPFGFVKIKEGAK